MRTWILYIWNILEYGYDIWAWIYLQGAFLGSWIDKRQGSRKWKAAATSFYLAAITHHQSETQPCSVHVLELQCKAFHQELCEGLAVKFCCSECAVLHHFMVGAMLTHRALEFLAITAQTLFNPPWIMQVQQGTHIPFKWQLLAQGSLIFGLAPPATH